MDLSQMKNKLASLTKPKTKYEKVDYSKIYWKPTVGKHQIRIVPSKFNKSNPFKEIFLHYGISKFPMMALTNWEEQDPIVQFANKLRKSTEKDDWQLAKKLDPKMRVVVPVIVRGEESLGVRLWEFGKENYQALLSIADDEDYGDYTDVENGRDFTVEGVSETAMGRTYVKTTLRIKPKTSLLSDDAVLVEKWLDEQPDIMTLYKKFSFDELKEILVKHLTPEDETEADVVEHESSNDDLGLPFTVEEEAPINKSKTNNADKFDDLFKDEK
jgi:hypothetical protein